MYLNECFDPAENCIACLEMEFTQWIVKFWSAHEIMSFHIGICKDWSPQVSQTVV